MWKYNNPDELYHHGILGMRWHHRKNKEDKKNWKYHKNQLYKARDEYNIKADRILSKENNAYVAQKKLNKLRNEIGNKYNDSIKYGERRQKRIKALKIAGALAAVAAIATIKIRNDRKQQTINAARAREASKNLDNLMKSPFTNSRKIVNVTSKAQIPKSAIKFDKNNPEHMYKLMFG